MKKLTSFEDHLEKERGRIGSKKRSKFDAESLVFRNGAIQHEVKLTKKYLKRNKDYKNT